MRYARYARYVSLLALAALASCERVVGIEVTEGPERLVVEARLEAVRGLVVSRQEIRLSTSAPYFSNTTTPPARDAVVEVVDEENARVRLAETSPGVYRTDSLPLTVGRSYTLQIRWKGDVYEATERLVEVAPIDTLYFRARPNKSAATDGVRATIDLRDPAGTANYYLWDQFIDGVRTVAPDTLVRVRVVASDELFNGRRVRVFQPFDGIAVRSGQEVRIRQYSISEAMWRYYQALGAQTDGDASPFGVPSASVRGNVANRTRPDARALGYFSVSQVAERVARVP